MLDVIFFEGSVDYFFCQILYFCFLIDEDCSEIINSFFIVVYDLLHFCFAFDLHLPPEQVFREK